MTLALYCSLGNCAKCAGKRCDCTCHGGRTPPGVAMDRGIDRPVKRAVPPPAAPNTEEPTVTVRAPRIPPKIEVKWEDPPPARSRAKSADRFGEVLEELRTKPGVWARIAIYQAASAAGTSRTVLIKRHPEFEFVARRTDDGHSNLFARFRGSPET